jgi:peptidoglycan/xylan/chitin deacetylase (PgdA/CDA1 family)
MSSSPPERFRLNPGPYYRLVALYENLLLWTTPGPEPKASMPNGVTILAYHRVSRDRDVLAVSPDRFRRQLELVRARGGRFISLEEVITRLDEPVSSPLVSVGFDDGYLDNLLVALPILEELEVPATIFLTSGIAAGREGFHWYRGAQPAAIRWADARAVAEHPLVDFQSHGVQHLRLPVLGDDALRHEVGAAREEIEQELGKPVTVYCYPAGLFGDREVRVARETGYAAAVSASPGVNLRGADLFRLKRLMVSRADGERRFAVKLAAGGFPESRLARFMRRRRASRGVSRSVSLGRRPSS